MLQFAQTQVRHGIGDGEAARDGCTCDCHVDCGAESPQGPAHPFAALGMLAQRIFTAKNFVLVQQTLSI